jgi:hypothetical protein
MVGETIIWTALPNGLTGEVADRRLRLSVFVSPRLVSDEPGLTLGEFPDFLDWPARLRGASFSVQARRTPDEEPGEPVPATVVSPAPDSALWAALFGPSTPVESHQPPEPSGTVVNSYSVSAIHAQLKQGHQTLAVEAPVVGPSLADLGVSIPMLAAFDQMAADEPVVDLDQAPEDLDSESLQGVLDGLAVNMFKADGVTSLTERVGAAIASARELARRDPEALVDVIPEATTVPGLTADPVEVTTSEFVRLVTFDRGPAASPTLTALGSESPEEAPLPDIPLPTFEFHRGMTLLADHPALMRMLGMIVDLEIPAGSIPLSASGQPVARQLQVMASLGEPLAGESVSPRTAYILEADRFFSAANDPDSPDNLHRLLDLRQEGQFELVELDVHGGGLKLVATLASSSGAAPEDDQGGAMPAMRTSGVSIARSRHGRRLMRRVADATKASAAMTNGEPPVLFAQDLTRGYRIDVLDQQSGAWRSLHQRVGTYVFREHPGGPRTVTVHDEGAVQHAITQPVGADGVTPDPDAEVYVHESLATWEGWSLAAPRPGKTITEDGPARFTNTAPEGFPQLDVSYQAKPGSLPRLRFGRDYQFRVRTVDLAGNSLTLDEATDLLDMIPLLGLEPPVLPADEDFTYRRFDPVVSPVLVPRAPFGEGEALERLVIRSRGITGTQQEAEELSALVRARRPDAEAYSATCERHVVPPKASQTTAETHGMFDASFGTGTAFRQTYNAARKERGRLTDITVVDVATGQEVPVDDPGAIETVATSDNGDGYVVHRGSRLQLPYLPDPMARGAALFGLRGFEPERPAGVLDASGQLRFVPSALPEETLARLGGSSLHVGFGADWPERLAFRLILAEPPTGQNIDFAPFWDPATRTLTVFLPQGDERTFRLSSFITLDDLEQLGAWQWLLEMNPGNPPDPGALEAALEGASWLLTPARTITLVHAVEQPLVTPELIGLRVHRDPGETFAYLGAEVPVDGNSTAKVDVLASWTEDVDPPGALGRECAAHVLDIDVNREGDPPAETFDTVPPGLYDPATSMLTLHAPFPDDQSGRTYLARHEFGDTRSRLVRYHVAASTRFREYFPPEVTGQPERMTLAGQQVEVAVPSTVRPPAPRVVSVLPTFAWAREVDDEGRHVSRRAGGIRVYLERPWFSSGNFELLGVVFADPSEYPPGEDLEPFVTTWGRDPIWAGDETLGAPDASAFPVSLVDADSLPLEERPELLVSVAAHEVRHDADRDLVYCDILLSGAPEVSYSPFVRLALARFQPNSLPGLEVSRVVLADFVQVPPERAVGVAPEPGNPDGFQVVVQGLSSLVATPLVDVTVEERIRGTTDDLGWEPAEGTPDVEVAPAETPPDETGLLWFGRVGLPAGRSPGQYRIVVREFERLASDDPEVTTGRLVFAETVIP